ncbi:hypothetical protein ASE23_11290 [Rhizobium sp. Root73]|nr:hypothetical protein ASE23_11290 [Rhizobium sp. Root73]
MKIDVKAHTGHNLSGIKHAPQLLCEAVLILRSRAAHLHKNLARLIKIQQLARAFRHPANAVRMA